MAVKSPAVCQQPLRDVSTVSGSTATVRHQVDERVAGLSQLCDGHSASLPDELSHRVQLSWSDGDKLPSVINHTCRQQVNSQCSVSYTALFSVRALKALCTTVTFKDFFLSTSHLTFTQQTGNEPEGSAF